MNRNPKDAVREVLRREPSTGMIDLWTAAGTGLQGQALASARKANQKGLVESLAFTQQQTAAAASVVGVRPEQFGKLGKLLETNIATVALDAMDDLGLDLGVLDDAATKILEGITGRAIDVIGTEVLGALDSVGPIVRFVVEWVTMVVNHNKAAAEYDAAVKAKVRGCIAPGYSAAIDRASRNDAIDLMAGTDWTRLFTPECRPYTTVGTWGDPDMQAKADAEGGLYGFTCCPSSRGRVIAPVGAGYGDRLQSFIVAKAPEGFYADTKALGFGLVPMLPAHPIARALLVYGGLVTEAGDGLPLTGAVGQNAWQILWSGGPTAFTVDGEQLANAWDEFTFLMLDDIRRNPERNGYPICEGWDQAGRDQFVNTVLDRLGTSKTVTPGATQKTTSGGEFVDPLELVNAVKDTRPVRDWHEFHAYQTAMLRRLGIAYVDARNCVPSWRNRVRAAQAELLEHPTAVCDLEVDSIADPVYLAEVKARRAKKGGLCMAGYANKIGLGGPVGPGEGPSLAPLGDDAPPLPKRPKPGRVGAGGTEPETAGGMAWLPWALLGTGTALVIGGTAWMFTRYRHTRR
jgi:hypothetical protein